MRYKISNIYNYIIYTESLLLTIYLKIYFLLTNNALPHYCAKFV